MWQRFSHTRWVTVCLHELFLFCLHELFLMNRMPVLLRQSSIILEVQPGKSCRAIRTFYFISFSNPQRITRSGFDRVQLNTLINSCFKLNARSLGQYWILGATKWNVASSYQSTPLRNSWKWSLSITLLQTVVVTGHPPDEFNTDSSQFWLPQVQQSARD